MPFIIPIKANNIKGENNDVKGCYTLNGIVTCYKYKNAEFITADLNSLVPEHNILTKGICQEMGPQ